MPHTQAESMAKRLNELMDSGAEDAIVSMCTTFRRVDSKALPLLECTGVQEDPMITTLSILNALLVGPYRLYLTAIQGKVRFAVTELLSDLGEQEGQV